MYPNCQPNEKCHNHHVGKNSSKIEKEINPRISSSTNLTLRDRSDPCNTQVDRNVHDAGDPEYSRVVSPVVAEDDSKDDATEVACRAGEARENAFRSKVS